MCFKYDFWGMTDVLTNNLSFWEKDTWFDQVDVAIIGSGLVGLSAAIAIKQQSPRLKVLVLERGALPSGASTKNAGFACFGSASELLDDLSKQGEELTWETVYMRWNGLRNLRELLGDAAIGYEGLGGYELFREADKDLYEASLDQLPELNRRLKEVIGKTAVFRPSNDKIGDFGFGGGAKHMILNSAEGQIHTGKMMLALTRKAQEVGVLLVHGITLTTLEQEEGGVVLVMSDGWKFKARKALLCTNGFAAQLMPQLDVVPARNQVLITQPIAGLKVNGCFHYDKGYFYLRNIDNRILIGGGRHLSPEVEQTAAFGTTELIRNALRDLLDTVFLPGVSWEEDFWWSGILGVGNSKKPLIEWVDTHIAVAVRMGGMGVAIGSLVGARGAKLISETL